MFNIPILILSYNRPNLFKKSFKAVLKIKPKKIYVANDGPKNNLEDIKRVNEIRKFINRINTKTLIKKKFNQSNLGCKKNNVEAINWFFKNEKNGIIIEDDCIPKINFFWFASKMLKKYRYNKKIYCISGSNFQEKRIDKFTYYFSKYNHCWGWATWKNRWIKNDSDIKFWPKYKKSSTWKNFHKNIIEKKYWQKIFDKCYEKKIDSWAYPWTLSVWKKKGLTVTPNFNLVKNIGYGPNSTNSKFNFEPIKYKNKTKFKKYFLHPKKILVNTYADEYVFNNHFKGKNLIWPYRFIYLFKILFKVCFKKKY